MILKSTASGNERKTESEFSCSPFCEICTRCKFRYTLPKNSTTTNRWKIIESLYFKRLQSIKQLSVVNWVFPGSEHTRFIHSLGVMHIADKIAISLGLTCQDRKIVRLAGLLHDIGHYPLSHVCEAPYKKPGCKSTMPYFLMEKH